MEATSGLIVRVEWKGITGHLRWRVGSTARREIEVSMERTRQKEREKETKE